MSENNSTIQDNDLVLRTKSICELCVKFFCFPCIYYYHHEELKPIKKRVDLCKT